MRRKLPSAEFLNAFTICPVTRIASSISLLVGLAKAFEREICMRSRSTRRAPSTPVAACKAEASQTRFAHRTRFRQFEPAWKTKDIWCIFGSWAAESASPIKDVSGQSRQEVSGVRFREKAQFPTDHSKTLSKKPQSSCKRWSAHSLGTGICSK